MEYRRTDGVVQHAQEYRSITTTSTRGVRCATTNTSADQRCGGRVIEETFYCTLFWCAQVVSSLFILFCSYAYVGTQCCARLNFLLLPLATMQHFYDTFWGANLPLYGFIAARDGTVARVERNIERRGGQQYGAFLVSHRVERFNDRVPCDRLLLGLDFECLGFAGK